MLFSAAKKKKDKDDGAPVIMTGTYMFSNGDKYGKYCRVGIRGW